MYGVGLEGDIDVVGAMLYSKVSWRQEGNMYSCAGKVRSRAFHVQLQAHDSGDFAGASGSFGRP